ncbi:hypothetical protein O3P69_005802 [Scylla paramamosain]|uniref:Uncharacterized protein n=1 Tax=Scylla paramamosain TaxID=85552 RepID=A0AAW0UCD4_SCYPA
MIVADNTVSVPATLPASLLTPDVNHKQPPESTCCEVGEKTSSLQQRTRDDGEARGTEEARVADLVTCGLDHLDTGIPQQASQLWPHIATTPPAHIATAPPAHIATTPPSRFTTRGQACVNARRHISSPHFFTALRLTFTVTETHLRNPGGPVDLQATTPASRDRPLNANRGARPLHSVAFLALFCVILDFMMQTILSVTIVAMVGRRGVSQQETEDACPLPDGQNTTEVMEVRRKAAKGKGDDSGSVACASYNDN